MTPEVSQALDELRRYFPGATVEAEEDGQGGAYVNVAPIEIGEKYSPNTTWFGFHITFQYPRADVYPLFTGSDVQRVDRAGHPSGVSAAPWRGKPALQFSRRSNRLDPTTDTAATKLAKVISWFGSL
jgi:hypothetical protein